MSDTQTHKHVMGLSFGWLQFRKLQLLQMLEKHPADKMLLRKCDSHIKCLANRNGSVGTNNEWRSVNTWSW